MFSKVFVEHPATIGETYLEHLTNALYFSRRLLAAAAACALHALCPAMFQKTASRIVGELHDRMVVNRSCQKAPADL